MDNGKNSDKKESGGRSLREKIIGALPLILFLLLLSALTFIFWPEVAALGTEEGGAAFSKLVRDSGFLGWLIALGVQLLQIFLAFIPGEPVEIMLGVLFGPWLGTFTCLFGIFIGTLAIDRKSVV